jgi:hypothetical protein
MELISSRGEVSSWRRFARRLTRGSGYDLEMALSVVSAKVQPLKFSEEG